MAARHHLVLADGKVRPEIAKSPRKLRLNHDQFVCKDQDGCGGDKEEPFSAATESINGSFWPHSLRYIIGLGAAGRFRRRRRRRRHRLQLDQSYGSIGKRERERLKQTQSNPATNRTSR